MANDTEYTPSATGIKVFEEELMPQIDALYNFAYHLTYNEEDANDLVQETYLKAYKYVDKYIQGTNPKAWLFKILKNGFINQYRKKSKRPTQIDYEDLGNYQNTNDASYVEYVDLRDEIFENIMGDEVSAAIDSLPVDFREVIILSDLEDFSYEDISKILEIPIGTVRSRIFRARNMLKEVLQGYAKGLGYEDKRGKKNKLS